MPKKMLAFFLAELKLQMRSVNPGRAARLLSCLRVAQDDAMAGHAHARAYKANAEKNARIFFG